MLAFPPGPWLLLSGSSVSLSTPVLPLPWSSKSQLKGLSCFSIRSLFCIQSQEPTFCRIRVTCSGPDQGLTLQRATCFGVSGSSVVKDSACHAGGAGDVGLIPGSGRFTGGEPGNPLEYSCLKKPMHRGAWRATVRGSQTVRHD